MILKSLAVAAWTAIALGTAASASAEAYPSRPITIVIGATPGSTTDGLVRSIAQEINKETGQVVVIDNKAGANGIIASQYVAHAAPDGYTVFVTTNTTHASNPYMY